MIVVDVAITVLIALAFLIGLGVGLFASIGWWAGIAAGAVASPWVVPIVSSVLPDRAWRGFALIGTVIALLVVGSAIGAGIGKVIRRGADKIRLRFFERFVGGLFTAASAAIVLVTAGSAISAAGIPVVSSSVASSKVLRTIEDNTPEPILEGLAMLRSFVVDDTLPSLRGAIDEGTTIPTPDVDTGSTALDEAAQSVARVSGVAYSCGTGATGSGFVIDDDLIVTNAHVVAGADTVMIELPGEPAVDGAVVYFDPVDDLAMISADVDAAPLDVVPSLSVGDSAVVQGYPYGGPFTAVPSTVIDVGEMPIDDVYGGEKSPREVYTLAAEVRPGNSGGPLLTPDGEVAGVVFARDLDDDRIGYAMTTAELLPAMASSGSEPVSTGACLP